ncbi:MAG: hypothetical protein ACYS9X_32650, partial [Planctomycetota bacterium]
RWDLGHPNFVTIERARAQGALVVLAGIAGGRERDPRAEIVAFDPSLARYYEDASLALDETACELPFDAATGVLPDALALSGSDADEAVWFALLNMRHRIPAALVDTIGFGAGVIPRERTFVNVGKETRPTAANFRDAIRRGRVMASAGPFVFISVGPVGPVGGKIQGSVHRADGSVREVVFKAFSSTEKGGEIDRLELVRNGEVVVNEPGQGRSRIEATSARRESETSWYIARARDASGRVAWTSPVYFEGPAYTPPRPVMTRITGRVTDAATGAPLAATVQAHLAGERVAQAASDPATGAYRIECPPAARLEASSPGYGARSVRVFFYTRAPELIRDIHTNASGRGAAVLADRETYEAMRAACASAEITLLLRRERPPPRR